MINITSAADLAVERFSIAQVIRINAEAAKTDGAEFLVADGNGILRTPVLVDLNSRGEKIDIGLERRLERFVPILQISQDRSEEHTSELQSRFDLVCRLLLEKKNKE